MASSFPVCLHLRPRTLVAEGDGLRGNWVLLLEHHWPSLQVGG